MATTKKKPTPKSPARPARAASSAAAPPRAPVERVSQVQIAGDAEPADAFAVIAPRVRARPPAKLLVCRADPAIVLANVRTAQHGLERHLADLPAHLPKLSAATITGTLPLARALLHAVSLVHPSSDSHEIESAFLRLRPLRTDALTSAALLAARGKLPPARVRKIEEGSGRFDEASDGVALAALFREFRTQIAGLHPLTDDEIAELGRLGNYLLDRITPSGARRPRDDARDAAARDRDLLFSQLVADYAQARKAGFYFYGEAVDENVPPLLARTNMRSEDDAETIAGPPVPGKAG